MEYTNKERLTWLLDEFFMVDDIGVTTGEDHKYKLGVTVDADKVAAVLKPRYIDEDLTDVIDRAM